MTHVKKKMKLVPFSDSLYELLKNPKVAAEYINEALNGEDSDSRILLKSIRQVAEAQGITQAIKKSGLSRRTFFHILSENGNPRLESLLPIITALGVTIRFEPAKLTKRTGT